MKLLITGEPRSGKSTILAKVISDVNPKNGFVTKESVADGQRTGFIMEDTGGHTAILAQTDTPTLNRVGRFYVEPNILAAFIVNLPPIQDDELLYIDEIGQMQLYSKEFKALVRMYLDAPNDFVGTITSVYHDDITKQVLARSDTVLFHLSIVNRKDVEECLRSVLRCRQQLSNLPHRLQLLTLKYANKYMISSSYVSFNKLFNNAINYFLEGRVHIKKPGVYTVQGNENAHVVSINSATDWSCDCHLSRGEKPFTQKSECSHFQAVRLLVESQS